MQLHKTGDFRQAELLCREVLSLNPVNFEAVQLLGIIALQSGRAQEGAGLIAQAVRLSPKNAELQANLGNAYSLLGRTEEALQAYDRAFALDSRFAGALSNRGALLQLLKRYEEAAETHRRLCDLAPRFEFSLGRFFESRRYACDWRDFAQHLIGIKSGIAVGRRMDHPFSFLSVTDSGIEQLQCARIYAASLSAASLPAAKETPACAGAYRHERPRIAYVSADFRSHVVMQLMAPIFASHDSTKFDIVGASLAPDDGSEILQRAKRSLGRFINVSHLNDAGAARSLRDLEIDIAVDLTGYTQGCRPGIFANRAAPVQVNFFGFPGTMGAPFMDYIIADAFVAPPESRAFFAEQIVRLPDSFQANGERSSVLTEPATPSRAQQGLPENAVVLCSFNNSYKINPATFDIWARIMRSVPLTVLWLLGDEPGSQRRLRGEAAARGVPPERLVFAQRAPYDLHIARLRLADLFLDTLPFNAGATAGDALWSGVPVLTCAGEAFAARMAGSVLRAVGLPELITYRAEDYERRAVELASDRTQLADLKARLAANRRTHPLFNVKLYCRHLEAAYMGMWERTQRGEAPAGFEVASLGGGS